MLGGERTLRAPRSSFPGRSGPIGRRERLKQAPRRSMGSDPGKSTNGVHRLYTGLPEKRC